VAVYDSQKLNRVDYKIEGVIDQREYEWRVNEIEEIKFEVCQTAFE